MESEFLHWLDSFPGHIGTMLAVVLGGFALLSAIFTGISKIKHDFEAKIAEVTLQEENDKRFKQDIKNMIKEVSLLKNNTEFLSKQYATTTVEINDKIDAISDILKDTRAISDKRDDAIEKQIKSYDENLELFRKEINENKEQLSLLIDSDKESIRSFIVDKYYQVMEDGFVNTHLLQVLEERYDKYLKEKGNGYVKSLMEEIRELPHKSPNNNIK
jgi:hypothetical protein|nr:MAG TPA: hypothetical protein [Caudoviricetes sp.]